LERGRAQFAETASPQSTEWAIENARVVHQCAQSEAWQLSRDEAMARNAKWILDQAPKGSRMVIWAHNAHISRAPVLGFRPMGAFLAEWYGKQYLPIGFAAGEGDYTAMVPNKGLRSDNHLQLPREGSCEEYFRAVGIPNFIVDLRQAVENDPGSGWLALPLPLRSLGALATDNQFGPAIKLGSQYDALIYLDKTTASRLLLRAGAPR
jgi:erythromycin esterase